MAIVEALALETLANLAGAFAGVFLAFFVERRTRRAVSHAEAARMRQEMDKTREAVMRSIVKNVGEARQVKDAMAANDAMLLEITLDLGAWEAVRTRYLELCPDVEERVTVSGFFGLVNDLRELVAFRRTAALGPTDLTVVAALERRLRVAAHDLSLEGGVAVNEFGGRIHKEILGLVE